MRSRRSGRSGAAAWLAGAIALACVATGAAQEPTASPAPAKTAAKAPAKTARPAAPKPTPPPPPPPIVVKTSVSKTAVWVGDRVTYTIELTCAPQVDIVTDDLAKERLHVDGLEIRDTGLDRQGTEATGLTYRATYSLVTFNIDSTALKIAEIPVRYSIRRPGQLPGDQAHPAGEIHIPALTLVLRSTLLDGEVPVAIRDGRPLQPLPRRIALAQPVGIGLLVIAAAPVGLLIFNVVRRASRTRSKGPKRVTRRERRASLEDIKALDVGSSGALREAYAKLDAWIREQTPKTTGIAVAAITPPELRGAIAHPEKAPQLDKIQELLIECERAKYASQPPDADRWPTALIEAEQLLDSAPAR